MKKEEHSVLFWLDSFTYWNKDSAPTSLYVREGNIRRWAHNNPGKVESLDFRNSKNCRVALDSGVPGEFQSFLSGSHVLTCSLYFDSLFWLTCGFYSLKTCFSEGPVMNFLYIMNGLSEFAPASNFLSVLLSSKYFRRWQNGFSPRFSKNPGCPFTHSFYP